MIHDVLKYSTQKHTLFEGIDSSFRVSLLHLIRLENLLLEFEVEKEP